MLFNEYLKIFEDVLALTEKIERLCLQGRSDETEEMFHQRNNLMQQLEVPEDVDEAKVAKILAIRDKISQKNTAIVNAMQKEKMRTQDGMRSIEREIMANKQKDAETFLKNSYKNPKPDNNDNNSSGGGFSIFNSK